ncbi:MAG: hypothetical protein ACK5MK_04970 [Dysgonomonas sp.]
MRKDESKKLFDLYKDKMSKLISSGSLQYPQYEGIITAEIIKDDYIFHYKYDTIDYQISISHKYYSDFLPLFENGLLHPKLIGCLLGTTMFVGQFEELHSTSDGTKRRYKLWSWCKGVMNPCEYTIELLNENTTNQTPTKKFIEEAIVVSISQCSIIL